MVQSTTFCWNGTTLFPSSFSFVPVSREPKNAPLDNNRDTWPIVTWPLASRRGVAETMSSFSLFQREYGLLIGVSAAAERNVSLVGVPHWLPPATQQPKLKTQRSALEIRICTDRFQQKWKLWVETSSQKLPPPSIRFWTLILGIMDAAHIAPLYQKYKWKPFWLATQLYPQNDWTGRQFCEDNDVCAQVPLCSLVEWNWLSDVTGCTWITCIRWFQRAHFTAPGCTACVSSKTGNADVIRCKLDCNDTKPLWKHNAAQTPDV